MIRDEHFPGRFRLTARSKGGTVRSSVVVAGDMERLRAAVSAALGDSEHSWQDHPDPAPKANVLCEHGAPVMLVEHIGPAGLIARK